MRCCRRKGQDYDYLNNKNDNEESLCSSESPFNLAAFFILGLINNFAYVVFLSGATDILDPGYPTSYVLLTEMIPIIIAQGLAPLFIERIPFWIRVIFITITACGSFLLVAFTDNLVIKLTGIAISSMSSGFGEITFMALSSGYNRNTVSLYSSGTGGAGVFGSLLYLSLRQWVKITPEWTLIASAPIPLLMAISYFLLLGPNKKPFMSSQSIGFCSKDDESPLPVIVNSNIPVVLNPPKTLTLKDKIRLQFRLSRYTGPLFLVYFSEYVINQGIVPALRFPKDKSFYPGEYIYYQFIYQVGVFVSRSSVNIFPIKPIWILALFQFVNVFILGTAAYFAYIPSIWIVFVVIFLEGLLGGGVFANAFYLVATEVEDELKEFCMSSLSFWYSIGILSSGLAGIFIQPWLESKNYWNNGKINPLPHHNVTEPYHIPIK